MQKVTVEGAPSCPTLCKPMAYTVRGILQARTLEWVAFCCSHGSSPPRDRTGVSCIAGRFFTSWALREAFGFRNAELMDDHATRQLCAEWQRPSPMEVSWKEPSQRWIGEQEQKQVSSGVIIPRAQIYRAIVGGRSAVKREILCKF